MILYILDTYPVLSETFIQRELEALQKAGIPIHVLAHKRPDSGTRTIEVPWPVIYLPTPLSPAGLILLISTFLCNPLFFLRSLILFFLMLPLGFRFSRQRLFGRLRALMVSRILKSAPFRIHAHFAYVACDTAEGLAALYGVPWTVSAHAWDIFTQPVNHLRIRVWSAETIFVCTQYGNNVISLRIPELSTRLVRMYHGIDFESIPKGPANHALSIDAVDLLAVGRLEEKKGFPVLIQAIARMKENGRHVSCRIIGDGPERENLTRSAVQAGVSEQIDFIGKQSIETVFAAMKSATIFVMPCRLTANGDCDGIPNTILEAMASGLPVIGTIVGGIPEAVENGKTGILVPPDDPDALAEAIGRLLNDPEQRKLLAENAGKKVRKDFDVSQNLKPILKLFQKET